MDFIWIKRFCRVSCLVEGDEFEKSIGDFLLDWFDNNSYRLADLWNNRIPKMIRTDKQMMVNSALATVFLN
jgi:O-succinylbenzoic acid--CoA ligase